MSHNLDLYDKKILYELDIDPRIPCSQLGKKINLAKESVNFRIKRLLEKEVIVYFYALINASVFGYQYYKVHVRLPKTTKEEEEEILNFLVAHPLCTNIRLTEGKYNLIFLIVEKSAAEFKEFLSKLGKILGDKLDDRNVSLVIRSHKFNQRILYGEQSHKIRLNHDNVLENKLDQKDKEILSFIGLKGRAKLTEIAERVKLDSKVVRYRMKNMEKTGAIAGYGVQINFEKLHYNFIQIDFIFPDPLTGSCVIGFFEKTNRLIRSYELLGKYDLSIEIYTKSDEELRNILEDFRNKFGDSYIRYDISRIFNNYATTWSPFRFEKDAFKREERIQRHNLG